MTSPQRALFIQLRRIGDVLMCTPAIRAFKKAYPDCALDFLTEHPDVLRNNPHLSSVIAVDRNHQYDPAYQYRLIRKLRSGRYELITDFFANPRSAYYAFLSGAPKRLSYGQGHRRWAYNMVPKKPDHLIYAAADRLNLLSYVGIHTDDYHLEFYPDEEDRIIANDLIASGKDGPIISVSPVSRQPYKRWPPRSFARLCDLIIENMKAHIVILVGPGESEIGNEVLGFMKLKSASVINVESLGILGALFEKVSLHIGNDNGPKHIAVACGGPTLTIFGPGSPVGWTDPDYSRHSWVTPTELCEDCEQKKNRCDASCIAGISVDSVWDKVKEIAGRLPAFESVLKKS